MKQKRRFHKLDLYNIVNDKDDDSKQRFLGRKRPVVKNKPKIYHKV